MINACSTSRESAQHLQTVITQLPRVTELCVAFLSPAICWALVSQHQGWSQTCQNTSAAGHKLTMRGCSAPVSRAVATSDSPPGPKVCLVSVLVPGLSRGLLRAPDSASPHRQLRVPGPGSAHTIPQPRLLEAAGATAKRPIAALIDTRLSIKIDSAADLVLQQRAAPSSR